jgi:CheY-like chemotaxis protein
MTKKILLADDSLTIQKVVELTLAGGDYALTCVPNGQKALESLQQSRPDLILADAVMPEKNGYEVCETVKGNPATARIPVVLLSGSFEPFDRERAERAGCDTVITKPFDAPHLLEQIDALCSRSGTAEPAPEEPPFETGFPVEAAAAPEGAPAAGAEGPFGRGDADSSPFLSLQEGESSAGLANPEGEHEATARYGQPVTAPEEIVLDDSEMTSAESFAAANPSPASPASPLVPPAGRPPEEIGAREISREEAVPREPAPEAAPPPAPEPLPELTEAQIDAIATRVVEMLSDRIIREIAWDVIPEMAEIVIKRRIKELESGVE